MVVRVWERGERGEGRGPRGTNHWQSIWLLFFFFFFFLVAVKRERKEGIVCVCGGIA